MGERDGQQLGNYRLLRRLGRGGAAEVYLGEHVFLNTQAAIKVLQAPLPEQDVPAFLREARTIAGLTHPHIIRVLDFGVQDETFYLVMEYAPKGTLRQIYPPGTRLSQSTVAMLVRQIADALQYAHDRNVIHCDVKPENILLDKDSKALLSDFGISLILQTMTAQQVEHIAGTIAYMAPEQFDGRPQRASDQYALAVIAYEWLSGERPFQGNVAAISSQHLYAQAAPLSSKVPGIPPAVDAALSVAMEKDPTRRFASIRAFARALEQAGEVMPAEIIPTFSESGPTVQATITPSPQPLPLRRVSCSDGLSGSVAAGTRAKSAGQKHSAAGFSGRPWRWRGRGGHAGGSGCIGQTERAIQARFRDISSLHARVKQACHACTGYNHDCRTDSTYDDLQSSSGRHACDLCWPEQCRGRCLLVAHSEQQAGGLL